MSGGRDDERLACVQRRPLDLESVEKQYVCARALAACAAWVAVRRLTKGRRYHDGTARASNAFAGNCFPALFSPPLRRRSAAKKTKKIDAAKNAKGGGVVGNARGKDMRGGAGAGQVRVKPGTAAAAAAR